MSIDKLLILSTRQRLTAPVKDLTKTAIDLRTEQTMRQDTIKDPKSKDKQSLFQHLTCIKSEVAFRDPAIFKQVKFIGHHLEPRINLRLKSCAKRSEVRERKMKTFRDSYKICRMNRELFTHRFRVDELNKILTYLKKTWG